MKSIFVAGANGFTGRNLCEQFKNKYRLLAPGRKELNLLDQKQVDNYFSKHKVDILIHCARVGGTRKEELLNSALRENLVIFFNLIKHKDSFDKIIFLGSGAEYDKSRPLVKIKESDFGKFIPRDDYGLYKYTAAKIIENMSNAVCLRLFGLFGKYENYRLRFISNAICLNLQGLPININQNVYFDYLYIDDLLKIIDYFILHQAKKKFYNIGAGTKIDLITLAKIINSVADQKSKIIVNKPGLNNEYSCNNDRLMREIGNFHFTEIKEAISELYLWYKKHQADLLFPTEDNRSK